ncbi:MAG TPA: DUF5916 domain-containing protein [Gemmatimonadales bacterium]|nr:DUF5916 domain-containing protein [Gemmatimonadales bacterium]
MSLSLSLALPFIASALLQAPPPAVPADSGISGRGAPAVTIPRLEAETRVDGVLDEAVWAQAVRLTGFSQYQPVDGRPAEERTEVLVWYDPTAIHFGILAHDRQPGAVRATLADRDNVDNDDNVTIYLDTFDDRRRAYFFTVNPLGVQQDGVRSEGAGSASNMNSGNVDESPDFLWQSKGRRTPEGYVVEVRIPFKSLRYPGGGAQRWGINVVRVTQRTGYQDTWTDVRRANASFLAQAGALVGLHDLRAGLVTEVQPFVTATSQGARLDDGTFDRAAIDPSAGVNLKLGLTNMALDATWNPDFSQVEADAGVVTVNERFALFFPERRPFFLEGIELFATPNNLIYTRQVADPVAGVKFTGKFGRVGIAHLTAVDNVPGEVTDPRTGTPRGAPDALFNAVRLRSDLGTNSTAGVTFTDRRAGGAANTVAEADVRYVFGKLYFLQGQLGQSWTRDSTGGALRRDPIWEAQFDRTGRAWGFNYTVTGIGPDFETRTGFLPRVGTVNAHGMNRLSWYGARGAFVEGLTLFFGPTRLWRYDDFLHRSPIEGDESMDASLNLRGGWRVRGHAERSFVVFDSTEYAGYTLDGATPYAFPERLDNAFTGSLSVTTPTYRGFDASASVSGGEVAIFPEASEGRQLRLSGSLRVRPTRQVRTAFDLVVDRLTRRRDGSEFARTIIPRVRAEYQPSRALFFRVIGEFQSQRRAALVDAMSGAPLVVGGVASAPTTSSRLRFDWLASYTPTPGTVAFFGYTSSLTGPDAFTIRGLQRANDGFFVKLAYLFRQ